MNTLQAYADARVLVTGANGFIGAHVARALSASGAEVTCVVRQLRRGTPPNALEADLADETVVPGVIASDEPDIVFNLAGYGVDPGERSEGPARALNSGLPVWIAIALAQLDSRKWRGQRLVHVGSALEYGTAPGDLAETTAATPTTLYGRTKLEGTVKLREFSTDHALRTATGRLFTVYGPGEHAGRLLPSLLAATRTTERLPLTAGLQLRDFTYVDDAVEGLLRLGLREENDLGPVNIATGILATVRSFVETAAEVLAIDRSRLDFGALPTRAEEMKHDPVNIERLRQLTGWKPSVTIREGILRTSRAPRG